MSTNKKVLPKREEIPVELTWKLEDIFETDEAWEQEMAKLQEEIPKIEQYQGKLGESAENLYEVLQLQDHLSERLGKLFTYAHMRYDQDTTNSFYQRLNAQAESIFTVASSKMSYIVPEILTIDEAKLNSFIDRRTRFARLSKNIR